MTSPAPLPVAAPDELDAAELLLAAPPLLEPVLLPQPASPATRAATTPTSEVPAPRLPPSGSGCASRTPPALPRGRRGRRREAPASISTLWSLLRLQFAIAIGSMFPRSLDTRPPPSWPVAR